MNNNLTGNPTLARKQEQEQLGQAAKILNDQRPGATIEELKEIKRLMGQGYWELAHQELTKLIDR